jgi:hypothetical protein
MTNAALEEIQRWTAKRRGALIVSILKGGDLCAAGSPHARARGGRDRGLAGALSSGPWRTGCGPARRTRRRSQTSTARSLKQKIGALVLDLDSLKEAAKHRPCPRGALGEVTAADPRVSERRLCRVVGLKRGALRRVARAPGARPRRVAPELVTRLIADCPAWLRRGTEQGLRRTESFLGPY